MDRNLSTTLIALYSAYTLLSVSGLLLLRRALPAWRLAPSLTSHDAVLVVLGAAAYIVGFALWMLILSSVPVARAYPTAVGLTLVFTAIGARFLLHEPLAWWHVAGMVVVFCGISLLSVPARA